ncbi:MAG: phosphomannomutase/phosphoglucomutase, partial [Planctomycetes bacterium]|nr:phosphomannomutase/phosphoglucomutase [Planctomycetota bacterium]
LAYHIGNATAQVLDLCGKSFCVARDMRVSGPSLKQCFIQGLVDAGVKVVDVGMVSTPALTFSSHHLDTAGGAMITASHNPSEYGGVKITGPGFKPISNETGLVDIEKLARAKTVVKADGGGITEATTANEYCELIAQLLDLDRPLKIVVDGGNGIIGTLFQHLSHKLPGITIIPMYFDPDGRFPNHDANPLKTENLTDLRKRVIDEGADFGAAFDGDGDRCALVDEKGGIVTCDLTTALLAKYYLAKEPNACICYDLRSSMVVPELIKELGGSSVETKVGHSFIKATMKENKAAFAGELSGHYYFRDFYGADSGLYAFILLANVISKAESLSSLITPLSKYFHSGEINFKVEDTAAVFNSIRKMDGAEIQELDGITARFLNADGSTDWWCNVRASNTEPVVRLNLEATTGETMETQLAMISELIQG